MQVINLINQTGCKIATFPDGEKHLTLDEINRKDSVAVICRIACADDLFILMQLGDILKRQEVVVETLVIGYLMSMRCDRLFSIDRPFSLKLVANAINEIGAMNVHIMEPHSLTSMRLINRSNGILSTLEFFIKEIAKREKSGLDVVAVLPDNGAWSRYRLQSIPHIVCEKVRNPDTGKLESFAVDTHKSGLGKDKDLVVLDDLCDGGGTFLGFAPKLRELEPKSLSLIVTHAIQLEGIKKVAEAYDRVYITNSYKDWDKCEDIPQNVTVFKVFE